MMTTTEMNVIAYLDAHNGRAAVSTLTCAVGDPREVLVALSKLDYDGVIRIVADGRRVELA